MIRLHRLWLLLIAFVLGMAVPPPVSVDVSPRVAHGPRNVRITARAERHPDNRRLVVVIDGSSYMRQDVDLNAGGQFEDARMHVRYFSRVPPGRYTVTADVHRVGGRWFRATSTFCLIGRDVSCE